MNFKSVRSSKFRLTKYAIKMCEIERDIFDGIQDHQDLLVLDMNKHFLIVINKRAGKVQLYRHEKVSRFKLHNYRGY